QDKGITQVQLADLVQISERAIQHYEAGTQLPAVDLAIEIATALNTDVTKIWGGIAMENIKFKELRKEFKQKGYVLSKNNDGSYSSTKDIGGGWTDEGNIVTNFKSLKEVEGYLNNEPMSLEEFDKM